MQITEESRGAHRCILKAGRTLPFLKFGILCAVAVVVSAPFSFLSATEDETSFETRGQLLLLHFVEKETQPGFAGVAARYAVGERINQAHQWMSILLSSPRPQVSYTFDLIATYLFGRQNLPYDLAERIRQTLSKNASIRGDAEHEWVMYYTALLLASETWPDLPAQKWFNGKSSAQNLREARRYLNYWMKSLIEKGQSEYDSPQFMPSFFASLVLLHEFTRDEELREQLKVVLNLVMIDFASEHLDGLYAGAHSRVEQEQILSPRDALSAGFAWLYFGTGKMVPSSALLFASLSSYTLSDIILELATNRDPLGGYVQLERKRSYRFNRYGQGDLSEVSKYSYITQHYILGSIQGGSYYPKDQQTWGLTYVSAEDRRPTLFIVHPSLTDYEAGTHYTQEPRVLAADARKAGAIDHTSLTGASAYERIFQHRNVMIGLYQSPDSLRQVRLNGFFSADLTGFEAPAEEGSRIKPDWIFCRGGDTFIAIYPLQPFHFERNNDGQFFISEGRPNGFVLEVSTPLESESFDVFKSRIQKISQVDLTQFQLQNLVKYTSIYGDEYEFSYAPQTGIEVRRFNNSPVNTTDYPLFSSPFLTHYPKEKKLVLRINNRWLVLDFEKWEMTENINTITQELQSDNQQR